MKYVTYGQVKVLRFAAACVCLVFLASALGKLYYDYSKINYFKKGEELYKAGKASAAEEWFMKAKSYKYFKYDESILSNRLNELKYVTSIKKFIEELSQDTKKASDSKNVEALIGQYNKYTERHKEETKAGKPNIEVFEEISKDYKIEEKLVKYFEAAKENLKAQADNNIKSRSFENEGFKKIILKMPAYYYGGEDKKKQEIDRFLKDYDSSKIDILARYVNIYRATSEAKDIIALSKENHRDYNWVIEKMELLWTDAINKDIKDSDYFGMLNHYREYEVFIKQYLPKSRVLAMVNDKIAADYNMAGKYSSDGNFEQALDLFKKISLFKDVKNDINRTQLKWIEKDPLVALNNVFPKIKFKISKSGLDLWGYAAYAVGSDDEGTLYLVSVTAENQYSGNMLKLFDNYNNGKKINSLNIMGELDMNGPVLLIETSSSKRKAEYIGFAVSKEGFKEVLRFEADGFTVEGKNRLLIDNPVGQGEGRQCYYTLKNGYYSFSEIKKDYVEITLDSIDKHKDEKVGFLCNILKYDYYNKWAIGTMGNMYVLLTDFKFLQVGNTYVIGKYAGEDMIYRNEVPVTVPKVTVYEIK